jgi:hypothetical protein
MTTAGMGMVNYQAQGDTNLETALGSVSLNANNVDSGENAQVTSSIFDTTKYDTIKFTITQLTSGTQALRLFGNYGSDPNIFLLMKNDLKANPVVSLSGFGAQKSNFRFQVRSFNDDPGNMATYRVSASFQRRTPINVFVSLDDPDASAFIRDGDFDRLSNAEKKKKLEEQLQSSNEYLNKMFGEGMPKGATTISDTEPQQSFMDIAQGLPYTDEDDAFDDPYYQGPPPDLDDDSDFDPDSFEYAQAGPGVRYPKFSDAPGSNRTRGQNAPLVPDYKYDPHMKMMVPNLPKAEKKKPKQITMVAHHEPEGEVIKEKKSFKDLTKKIPGYYDGKPSPLGFPVEEPPKMKNGFHPDLVDGKKVANRFNRLDI